LLQTPIENGISQTLWLKGLHVALQYNLSLDEVSQLLPSIQGILDKLNDAHYSFEDKLIVADILKEFTKYSLNLLPESFSIFASGMQDMLNLAIQTGHQRLASEILYSFCSVAENGNTTLLFNALHYIFDSHDSLEFDKSVYDRVMSMQKVIGKEREVFFWQLPLEIYHGKKVYQRDHAPLLLLSWALPFKY
jgi:hypothetical protein